MTIVLNDFGASKSSHGSKAMHPCMHEVHYGKNDLDHSQRQFEFHKQVGSFFGFNKLADI